MGGIQLLDCTLRDGGFVNDWEFGISTIRDILSRLDQAHVDIIEVGFLDDRRNFDVNRTILPDTKSLGPMFKNYKKGNAIYVAMIDYGTCDIKNIAPCEDSCIDGIRVIFKKKNRDEALAFCKEIKDLGYRLFVQPVSITAYSDDDMVELVQMVNQIDPYGMSLVDTYGLLLKKDLLRYYTIINDNLSRDIRIGYHAHNNFQLAYANCMELLEEMGDRNIVLDSSVYGMGKGAGNTTTELLATHLNKYQGKDYDIDQILEIVDIDIMKFYKQKQWGYSLLYFLAASNDCHPTYVKHLLDKKTLSVKSINEILSAIPAEKKLTFYSELIEELYLTYQTSTINERPGVDRLKQALSGRNVLILAPGSTLQSQKETVDAYIQAENPLIFSVNFLPEEYKADFVFVGNTKRYSQLVGRYYSVQYNYELLTTSNVTQSEIPIDYTFNYADLLNEDPRIQDNSTLLLINLLRKIGCTNVHLAGFDGFSPTRPSNFAYSFLDFVIPDQQMEDMNTAIKQYIQGQRNHMQIESLTKSMYDQ